MGMGGVWACDVLIIKKEFFIPNPVETVFFDIEPRQTSPLLNVIWFYSSFRAFN